MSGGDWAAVFALVASPAFWPVAVLIGLLIGPLLAKWLDRDREREYQARMREIRKMQENTDAMLREMRRGRE